MTPSAAARCRRCHLAIVTTTDAERKNIKQQDLVSNLAFWWNSLKWLKLRRQQWDNGLTSHFRSGRQSLSCCFQIDFQYWKYQRERGISKCKLEIPRGEEPSTTKSNWTIERFSVDIVQCPLDKLLKNNCKNCVHRTTVRSVKLS